MEPIDHSTVWPYDADGEPGAFVYQRYAHPTGAAAERDSGAWKAETPFSSARERPR